jgi:hypothetical protein
MLKELEVVWSSMEFQHEVRAKDWKLFYFPKMGDIVYMYLFCS